MAPECIAQGIQPPPSAPAVGLEGNAVIEAHILYALKITHVAVCQSLAQLGCREVTGIRQRPTRNPWIWKAVACGE